MLPHLVLQLAAASVLVAAAPGAFAQTPPPATRTTRILAIGTFAPGTDMQLVQRTLAAEVRATAELYLEGRIDQWYSLGNRPGVVFILNVTDVGAAQAMLEALPLGKAHLMTFELNPIGPLNPLRQLLKSPLSGKETGAIQGDAGSNAADKRENRALWGRRVAES